MALNVAASDDLADGVVAWLDSEDVVICVCHIEQAFIEEPPNAVTLCMSEQDFENFMDFKNRHPSITFH